MLHAPLPPYSMDSFDDHMDELEEDGTNLLQDFISTEPAVSYTSTTPLGYTSEESDYTMTTSSEEQMYSDLSLLRADSNELVEVVADFCANDDLTSLSARQQEVFAVKMIKGKTSKYRGVTQTSKTSWGAKYSAKRITNTCKTPDEAAHAYDAYLRSHHPEKYARFANFCIQCSAFVNPLGLPEYQNECRCGDLMGSDHDGGVTETESPFHSPSPLSRSCTSGDEEVSKEEEYRGSNLSISSLKLSFLDAQEPLFDEEATMLPSPTVKQDSMTMNVVESLTNDMSMDRILNGMSRAQSTGSLTYTQPFPMGDHGMISTEDISAEEWQRLSTYLQSDVTNEPIMEQVQPIKQQSVRQYRRIHSLDYDLQMEPLETCVKQEETSVMDVDVLVSDMIPESTDKVPLLHPTESSSSFPARIEMMTPFLEKYWRNDRKNIQCFPYCPEHGDYYRIRIEDLHHRGKGVCRAPVKAHVVIPTTAPLEPSRLVLLARCNSTFSSHVALTSQQQLNTTEVKHLQALSAIGTIDHFRILSETSVVEFDVTFYPDVWKFEFDLPKKRRHLEVDDMNGEFLYFFEMDVFYSTDTVVYERLGHAKSLNFQIGNTRTLLRQRNRITSTAPTSQGRVDMDRIMDMSAMPEKKKVKMFMGRLARPKSGEVDGYVVDSKAILSTGYITGKSSNAIQTGATHMDVDTLCRLDSNDSAFEKMPIVVHDGSERWKDHDDASSNDHVDAYNCYISPKVINTSALHLTDVDIENAMNQSKITAAVALDRSGAQNRLDKLIESHSWVKLFSYSLLCVPLSFVFTPLAVLLLVVFFAVPPLSAAMVRLLEAMSDFELRCANSSTIVSDPRIVLNRLEAKSSSHVFRFHTNGAVWKRFMYFCGPKLLLSTVTVVVALILSVLGWVLYPIRPVSNGLLLAANSIVLVSRELTRYSVGKPYSHERGTSDTIGMV